jgi:transcription factor WhiB
VDALPDHAAARDRLDVRHSTACQQCGAQFVPVARPGGRGHKFCSKRCADDSWNAKKKIGPRAAPLVQEYAILLALPPLPWQVGLWGLCVTGGYPSYWTGDDPADRETARRICRACPARIACAEWSLHLPVNDNAVYAGLNKNGRRRLRRQRAAASAP